MKTKIISIDKKYDDIDKQPVLSSLMVATLLVACEKQSKGISFGPRDIKGSFTALVRRGLIQVRNTKNTNGKEAANWQVSVEAIGILKAMGITVNC